MHVNFHQNIIYDPPPNRKHNVFAKYDDKIGMNFLWCPLIFVFFVVYVLQGLNVSLKHTFIYKCTVLPAKSDSDAMFCLHSYHGLRIDKSLVY